MGASQLRALPGTASIPIVFITGSDATVHQTLSRGLGAVSHLPKPFTVAQLLRAVGQALRGAQG
jgi:CheY-like chemotaxis protein